MKKFILFSFIFISATHVFSQQKRKSDGRKEILSKSDSILISKLCDKNWNWIEGHEDKNKYGSFVFSLFFNSDGFVTYNQRKTPYTWKIFNGTYVAISADKNLIDNEEHPYGILEGKFLIAENSDSFLVLKKLKLNRKDKETTFKLERDDFFHWTGNNNIALSSNYKQIEGSGYFNTNSWSETETETESGKTIIMKKGPIEVYKKIIYNDGRPAEYYMNTLGDANNASKKKPVLMYDSEAEEEYQLEPGKIITIQKLKEGIYKKIVYRDKSETEYFLNDLKLPGLIVETIPTGK